MPGTRGEFDRSLEAIEAKVVELFVMIVEDLPRAAQALEDVGGETARVLAERERVIDTLYLEVESLASREVLLQAPVAADLRFLLSVLRVTPELERSHDLVMQVADRAGLAAPGGGLTPRARALAAQMGDLASGMWRQAADAWYQRDRRAAAALAGRGQEMGELHASLAAELGAGQVTAPAAMAMTLVARCYQRLGAHAVNIARRSGYLAGSAGG
jgi:phosphate transport system protein